MFYKEKISSKIQNWFYEKFNENTDLNEKYLDSGSIDSFEIIELVSFLESTYNVKFSSEDFSDPRFFSINGLSKLISEKISKTKI